MVANAGDPLAPGSSFKMIDGVGHFLHLEKPDLIAEIVCAWLDANSPSQEEPREPRRGLIPGCVAQFGEESLARRQ